MIDLVRLAQVAEGADLPPTVREAVRLLTSLPVLSVEQPPAPLRSQIEPGCYVMVPVR